MLFLCLMVGVALGLGIICMHAYAQEVRLRMRVVPSVEGNVTHIIVGMAPGRYRVVCGPDTMYVHCTENSLHFRGRVVSPTHVVREGE